MRQIVVFILFSLLFLTTNAQNLLPLNYDTLQRGQELNLFISGEYASSTVSNKLINRFVFGGEISNDLILKIDGKQKSLNRIGFYAEPTIEYANYQVKPFKKQNWGIIVKAGMLYSGASRYRDGLFGLAFRGNEPYLGSEIDLSNMVVGFSTAHKIGFGFIDAKSKSSVTLNLYGITNYVSAYTNDASFKQDETGFNAELMLTGKFESTTKSPYYKGVGVGIDADFYLKVGRDEKPSFIQFSVRNLGVGFLNNSIVRYQMDTTIQQNGYTIADLVDGNTLFGKDKEIMDELGVQRDTISKTVALPFTVQVGKIIDEHNTKPFQLFFGGKMYVQNGALPVVYIGGQYRTKSWFRIGAGVSYGGFTGLRGNLYAQGIWNKYSIGIATSDVAGMIGLGRGYACSLNMSYRF